MCARVCASGAGGILISIQSHTISLAQPLKDEGFSESLPRTPMTPAGWASIAIFKCSPKPWENYVNPERFPQYVESTQRCERVDNGEREGNREKSKRSAVSDRCQHLAFYLAKIETIHYRTNELFFALNP